jgi:hypothetical protein
MRSRGRRCLRFTLTHALPLKASALETLARKPERVALHGARDWSGSEIRAAACERLPTARAETCSSAFWRRFGND